MKNEIIVPLAGKEVNRALAAKKKIINLFIYRTIDLLLRWKYMNYKSHKNIELCK